MLQCIDNVMYAGFCAISTIMCTEQAANYRYR